MKYLLIAAVGIVAAIVLAAVMGDVICDLLGPLAGEGCR